MRMDESGFVVRHTVEPTPHYRSYMELYKSMHGIYPPECELHTKLCEATCRQVEQQMPLLPPCKHHFRMLRAISFASSLTTLIASGQVPDFKLGLQWTPMKMRRSLFF
jgi:hypothetical protein